MGEYGQMAVDVLTAITIARPRAVVSAFAADPDKAPLWYANIRSIDWVSEPGVRCGAQMRFVAEFLGRRLVYTYTIAAFEPDKRLVMQTDEGPFPMETTYLWADAADGGTHMSIRNRGEPAGFSKFAALLMVPAMRRANRKDLTRLRRILEV